jgi:hypothetical protein
MTELRTPPPRNEDGSVLPHDHLQIEDDHRVIRRISLEQVVTRSDGRKTLSSQCFKPSSDPFEGLSVDIESWLIEDRIPLEAFLLSDRYPGAVVIVVGDARGLTRQVGWDPISAEGDQAENQYHGEVWGITRTSKPNQRAIQRISSWLFPIDGVDVS